MGSEMCIRDRSFMFVYYNIVWYSTAWKDFDELLINTIQEYPCLFNVKLKEFKNVQMKVNAWKKVVETTESTGTSMLLLRSVCMRIFVKVGLWGRKIMVFSLAVLKIRGPVH